MAEPKEAKTTKGESRVLESEREGLVTSWLTQGAGLAERTVGTCFGIVRDVRVEVSQRILGTLQWMESSQDGVFKLMRTIEERLDRLTGDALDAAESVTLGVVRTISEAGHGVTDIAGGLTRPRDVNRAA
jgi:hypothetical protein